ncbi:MAG: hypothetical protein ACKPKO_33335, partial [Candidatus Fonsibacter sp.]
QRLTCVARTSRSCVDDVNDQNLSFSDSQYYQQHTTPPGQATRPAAVRAEWLQRARPVQGSLLLMSIRPNSHYDDGICLM